MDYNTDRERMVLPEYGRNVQNMVDYALTISDREERQHCAETIVKVMERMYPVISEMLDASSVLWNHLARISRYQLDIDYPVKIEREEAAAKPRPLSYPMKKITYRHYGYLLEELLKKAAEMEDNAERDVLIGMIADQMRKDLFYWNKDALNDDKIADDITNFTDGKIRIGNGKFRLSESSANARALKTLATDRKNK